jgi:hypothetical protein
MHSPISLAHERAYGSHNMYSIEDAGVAKDGVRDMGGIDVQLGMSLDVLVLRHGCSFLLLLSDCCDIGGGVEVVVLQVSKYNRGELLEWRSSH